MQTHSPSSHGTTKPKVVFISGASQGIGRACADLLVTRGITVVGVSRRPPESVAWDHITMDVDDDESVNTGMAEVSSKHGGIDAVVACAGWGLAGSVEATSMAEAHAQFETNFFGVARTVRAALPSLRQRGGRIIILSSVAGVIGVPFQAYYAASKFALEGWAESLAWEVNPFGVSVSLVQAGNFRSNFTASRRVSAAEPGSPYAIAQQQALQRMERDEQRGADPAAAARTVERLLTCARPPLRVTVGPPGDRMGTFAKRMLPWRVFRAAAKTQLTGT